LAQQGSSIRSTYRLSDGTVETKVRIVPDPTSLILLGSHQYHTASVLLDQSYHTWYHVVTTARKSWRTSYGTDSAAPTIPCLSLSLHLLLHLYLLLLLLLLLRVHVFPTASRPQCTAVPHSGLGSLIRPLFGDYLHETCIKFDLLLANAQ